MNKFIKLNLARIDITKLVAYSYQHSGDNQKPAVFLMLHNEPKRITLLCQSNEEVDQCIKQLDAHLHIDNNE